MLIFDESYEYLFRICDGHKQIATTMMSFHWFLLSLLLIPRAFAFLVVPLHQTVSQVPLSSTSNPMSASVSTVDDADDCILSTSPAVVLGSPIDDASKSFNRQIVHSLKAFLFDVLFQGSGVQRMYARFYALETVARMPYFAYLSVLHLLETLGHWRRADYLKIHFAESVNELHHLLIMEELGGNTRWADRFVAQHAAFFYYWIVVGLYLVNPMNAYNLNQCVEEEAFETYRNFLTLHQDYLQSQPAPTAAVQYYTGQDLYLFDAMHHDSTRRPVCRTLYDCFVNIRDDELEHVKTMEHLQENECQV